MGGMYGLFRADIAIGSRRYDHMMQGEGGHLG